MVMWWLKRILLLAFIAGIALWVCSDFELSG